MSLDYEGLRLLWWVLLGILIIGFCIMDGIDFGVAMLLPWVANSDVERRIVINTVGPVWESNQVWFILGGGAIFAAWPYLYAVAFSGFYGAMFLLLCAFILRPVAFKYRSKLQNTRWRQTWDGVLFVTGCVVPFIIGIALGNALQGVPFHFDNDLRVYYTGSLWQLLNPFALGMGVLFVSLFMMHGGTYLAAKTIAEVRARTIHWVRYSAVVNLVLILLLGVCLAYSVLGYHIEGVINHSAVSNPLHKTVTQAVGHSLLQFKQYTWLWILPVMTVSSLIKVMWWVARGRSKISVVCSAWALMTIVTSLGVVLFPFLLPSSTHPNMSLTVWDASSSELTLMIMLGLTIVFIPIILMYVSWGYRVLRGPITKETIEHSPGALY